jgi:ubiquinone biosynthesis protein UbiJ
MSTLSEELKIAAAKALEQAMGAYLRLDPEMIPRLAQFEGKVIAVQWQDTDWCLYLAPGAEGIQVLSHFHGTADTTLVGRPLAFAKLAGGGDSSGVLFSGEVKIHGDVELGQRFKAVLDQMDIDWEEWLSKLTGDVLAHKAGHALRELRGWWQQSTEQAGHNAAEYLQQEIKTVPTREQVETFYSEVARLRDDVERAAARLSHLQQQRHSE